MSAAEQLAPRFTGLTLLPHRLLVHLVYILPYTSARGLDFVRPPGPDYLPHEIPTLLRRRLIAFLLGTYPVPPSQIATLIPEDEAEAARKAFRQLVLAGVSPGDALLSLDILARKEWCNVPKVSAATILATGCDCIGPPGFVGLVPSSLGEVVDHEHRIIRCCEVLAQIEGEYPTAPYLRSGV